MSEPTQIWTCSCGQTELEAETRGGSRVLCYCEDCQAFARFFGRTDMLDGQGGSDLYQVAPHQVRFRRGEEHLGALRLTDKGPARWYAACCGTPMANTWTSRTLPFVTVTAAQFDHAEALGPLQAQTFRKQAIGYAEKEGGGVGALYLSFGRRLAAAFMTGKWKLTPFFEPDGTPKAAFRRLTDAERSAAYDRERTV